MIVCDKCRDEIPKDKCTLIRNKMLCESCNTDLMAWLNTSKKSTLTKILDTIFWPIRKK